MSYILNTVLQCLRDGGNPSTDLPDEFFDKALRPYGSKSTPKPKQKQKVSLRNNLRLLRNEVR
jgi:hypothetical protein